MRRDDGRSRRLLEAQADAVAKAVDLVLAKPVALAHPMCYAVEPGDGDARLEAARAEATISRYVAISSAWRASGRPSTKVRARLAQ